jgi:hypothetical protein
MKLELNLKVRENEGLKRKFSQMKGDLYFQNLDPKPLDTLVVPLKKNCFSSKM